MLQFTFNITQCSSAFLMSVMDCSPEVQKHGLVSYGSINRVCRTDRTEHEKCKKKKKRKIKGANVRQECKLAVLMAERSPLRCREQEQNALICLAVMAGIPHALIPQSQGCWMHACGTPFLFLNVSVL